MLEKVFEEEKNENKKGKIWGEEEIIYKKLYTVERRQESKRSG